MTDQLLENTRKAEAYLQRFKDNITGHFINGQKHAGSSGKTFENTTPVDNSGLGRVAEGSAEDIDMACQAAAAAFPACSC